MDTDLRHYNVTDAIRAKALEIGFSACGFALVSDVPDAVYQHWHEWIASGKQSSMGYMEQHATLRRNPQGLLPDARTVISLALNYYPSESIPAGNPRFARYAYGADYHDVMRRMMGELVEYIQSLQCCDCRCCCDTAPIFERYWAVQAGLGFVGRNSQLIIPGRGSYFFLGEVLTTLTLQPDQPLKSQCGDCRKCIDACPVGAIGEDRSIDARRCISCQTIENRDAIPAEVAQRLGRRVYGCDTCQEVCPHNRHATPTHVAAFAPRAEFLTLTYQRMRQLTQADFSRIFAGSAVKRAKYQGLMRNVEALDPNLFE
jgi:epoxyqueuosine reductase